MTLTEFAAIGLVILLALFMVPGSIAQLRRKPVPVMVRHECLGTPVHTHTELSALYGTCPKCGGFGREVS